MQLFSAAFAEGETIPKKYSRDASNSNPPLSWSDVPNGTVSFALIMEDPDVPAAAGVPVWDHWVVWNIPSTITNIPESWDVVGTPGKGTRGETVYAGPRPPDREHRYFFRLLALDTMLTLAEGATKAELLTVMNGHVLAEAVLMGRFAPQQ